MKKRKIAYAADYVDGSTIGPINSVSSDAGDSDIVLMHPNGYTGLTKEGGIVIQLTNKTGAASVKGTLVQASTTHAQSFELDSADSNHPIGVVYEDGVADASLCWVVISGRCQVKLENNVGSTVGYWVRTSAGSLGRADITNAAPPGGGIPELDVHMTECGHCLETVAGDAGGALCYIILHFN